MSTDDSTAPGPELLNQLDADYKPILSFAEWASGAPNVGDEWNAYTKLFADVRSQVSPEAASDIVKGAMRAAATNTGAIEGLHGASRGLTFSVLTQAVEWQTAIAAEEGPLAAELALAALEGYEMALDLATQGIEIAESWIRRIHEVVCAPQQTYRVMTPQGWQEHPLPKGTYKRAPNHVRTSDNSFHSYAPVTDTPDEMHRLVEDLRSAEFETAHPALQTAYVHHAFTSIHPFSDGNGRVARVLASVYTLRSVSVPLVIFEDQKAVYFNALEQADHRSPLPFVDFVSDRIVEILGYLINILQASQESATDQLDRIFNMLTGQGGLPHREIDLVAARLGSLMREKVDEAAGELSLLPGLHLETTGTSYPLFGNPLSTFRVATPDGLTLPVGAIVIKSDPPAQCAVMLGFDVLVNKSRSDRFPFLLRIAWGKSIGPGGFQLEAGENLSVKLDQVHPAPTTGFQLVLASFARRQVNHAFRNLADLIQTVIRNAGLSS